MFLSPAPLPQFRNHKIVYRRYAGLFFSMCVDANDNELAWLESIHLFVEVLGQLTPFPFDSLPRTLLSVRLY